MLPSNPPTPDLDAKPSVKNGGAKKMITYVFEITDEKLWRAQMNPLYKDGFAIPGLRCTGMSVGDLMEVAEAFEEADPDAYEKAYEQHVRRYLKEDKEAAK